MGMIKSKREIKLLRKSAKIANSCIEVIEKSLKENITEKELAKRIRRKLKEKGAKQSFQIIVASGKRSAQIHANPRASDRIISGIGYVDFGACYKGYRSDITVPFIKGEVGKREHKIVDTTLRAYKLAIKSIKAEDFCWKLFEKIDSFLVKHGFELSHGLGHGIGMKIHELPSILKPKKKRLSKEKRKKWDKLKMIKFEENMVFTIEPGVYVKSVGGCRIENDILLTKRGPEVLTNSRLVKI